MQQPALPTHEAAAKTATQLALDAGGARRRWAKLLHFFASAAPLITALVLALTADSFPPPPMDNRMPDPSWRMILDYARQQNLQFGTDLAYTYGPLGFLVFPCFSNYAAGIRMVVDLAISFIATAGFCLVAWRLRWLSRTLGLCAFAWCAANMSTLADVMDFMLLVGLFCWGLLCVLEWPKHRFRRQAVVVRAVVFVVLVLFSALAKVSFFFLGSAAIALVTIGFALSGNLRGAVAIGGGCVAGFLYCWILAGQSLSNLGSFVTNGLSMVSGYDHALGIGDPERVQSRTFAIAALVAALLCVELARAFRTTDRPSRLSRLIAVAWVGLFAFASWKHGIVRADVMHLWEFFSFVTLVALTAGALSSPTGEPTRVSVAAEATTRDSRLQAIWNARARVLMIAIAVVAFSTLQEFYFQSIAKSLGQPLRTIAANCIRLLYPSAYLQSTAAWVETNRTAAQLPKMRRLIGAGSTDVFGQSQVYAMFNDLNYHPRPLPQSYAACSLRLSKLNEQSYLRNPPQCVLFCLEPLEHKFPPLEDSLLLRHLLINYELADQEEPFLLLKAKTSEAARLSLLKQGESPLHEPLDLRPFGEANLWLELDLKPSFLGKLREWFYRPPMIRVAAWEAPARRLIVRQRAPDSMLAAGFIASPLLARQQDVLELYSKRAVVRPGAYSIELPAGTEKFWRKEIRYRIYGIENPIARWAPVNKPGDNSGLTQSQSPKSSSAPFSLFHAKRWRPDRAARGHAGENAAFGLFAGLLLISGTNLVFFLRIQRRSRQSEGSTHSWKTIAAGNVLSFSTLVALLLVSGEIYFRFIYDATDSLGYTKVSERWVDRHWRVNSAGCRDNIEYAPAVAPGKRRLTFVGDSFTAGHGIKDVDNRFPNLLRQAHPEWEVQVLANVGLDTGGEIKLLEKAFAKGYQADQVVLVYCLNDIQDLLMSDEGRDFEAAFASLDSGGWLVRNSYFANFLYHRYQAARNPLLKSYFPFLRDAYRGAVWEQQKERLKAFRDLVQAHGGTLSVVTFPFFHALGPDYEYQFVHEKLDQFWRELGVPHLDLLSAYRGLKPQQLTVNRYDAHPNECASRIAANAIDQFLAKVPDNGFSRHAPAESHPEAEKN
jgi:hypothetical protein